MISNVEHFFMFIGHLYVLNIIKAICDKLTANIILNGKNLKCFPKIRDNRGISAFTTATQHSTGSLSHSNQTRRIIKGIQIGKEEVKLSLFADDIILYGENPKDSTKKLLDLINYFSKVARCKLNIQKSMTFLYTNN